MNSMLLRSILKLLIEYVLTNGASFSGTEAPLLEQIRLGDGQSRPTLTQGHDRTSLPDLQSGGGQPRIQPFAPLSGARSPFRTSTIG